MYIPVMVHFFLIIQFLYFVLFCFFFLIFKNKKNNKQCSLSVTKLTSKFVDHPNWPIITGTVNNLASMLIMLLMNRCCRGSFGYFDHALVILPKQNLNIEIEFGKLLIVPRPDETIRRTYT